VGGLPGFGRYLSKGPIQYLTGRGVACPGKYGVDNLDTEEHVLLNPPFMDKNFVNISRRRGEGEDANDNVEKSLLELEGIITCQKDFKA